MAPEISTYAFIVVSIRSKAPSIATTKGQCWLNVTVAGMQLLTGHGDKNPACESECLNRASPADDSEQDHHNGNYQKNMDEAAEGIGSDQAKKPQD